MGKIAKDYSLSYKAKGLFLQMKYAAETSDAPLSVRTLARMAKDGTESVRSGLQELEKAGYLTRTQVRENGVIIGTNYTLIESPPYPNTNTEGGRNGTSF